MPFTVTHIAAAVPIAWLSRWRLPFSALAIGSMVPDIAGYYPSLLDYRATHSISGVFTHCLPIGVMLYYVYQVWLKRPFFDLCPVAVTSRLRPWIDRPIDFSLPAIAAVFCCVALGAATHVFWDSFTHFRGWGVAAFPTLNRRMPIDIAGRPTRWFGLIQHASSLLLVPMTLGLIWWILGLPRQPDQADRARVPRGAVWSMAFLIAIGTLIYFQHVRSISPDRNWISCLAIATKRSGAFTMMLFLLYALGMNLLWWRDRLRPPYVLGDQGPSG